MKLYPRLDRAIARQLAAEYRILGPTELSEAVARHRADLSASPEQRRRWLYFAASGGTRATHREQLALRDALFECAEQQGWRPGTESMLNDDGRREVDRALAKRLFVEMDVGPAEVADGGSWAWMTCFVAPELVRWRFSGEGIDIRRFTANRVRNLYGRLWWRAWTFHQEDATNPWELLDALGEDELVQLMERTALSTQRPVVQAIARSFLNAVKADPELKRMDLLREVGKRLRRLMGLLALEALDSESLTSTLDELIAEVAEAMGGKARRRPRGSGRKAEPSPMSPMSSTLGVSMPPLSEELPTEGQPEVGRRSPASARRDPVGVLEPPGLIQRSLEQLKIRTVGDLLKLDPGVLDGQSGIGPKRLEIILQLKAQALRHMEVARCAALPVTGSAAQRQDLRRLHARLRRENVSPVVRLEKMIEAVAREGFAEPFEGTRRGRPASWRVNFGSADGPEVDLDRTLVGITNVGLEEIETNRSARLGLSIHFAACWNWFAERPSCFVGGKAVPALPIDGD